MATQTQTQTQTEAQKRTGETSSAALVRFLNSSGQVVGKFWHVSAKELREAFNAHARATGDCEPVGPAVFGRLMSAYIADEAVNLYRVSRGKHTWGPESGRVRYDGIALITAEEAERAHRELVEVIPVFEAEAARLEQVSV